MGAVGLRPIHKVRLKNLNDLIDKRFSGNASEAARAIERSHTFIWQLINGYRSIGEETARNIEKALGLGSNALDAEMRRSTTLTMQDGEGNQLHYRVVPVRSLDDLDAKPSGYRVCPVSDAGDDTFCAEMRGEEMAEVSPGDVMFIDPDQRAPINRHLYLVRRKGAAPRVLLARQQSAQRFVFVPTAAAMAAERPVPAEDVKVLGGLILVMRDLR